MNPYFSIVIPVLNGKTVIGLVLRCLEAQTLPREDFECIVVDDGSTDGTREWLQNCRLNLNLQVISNPVNLGRSAARNRGWPLSPVHAIVVFLDCDMLVPPDWLEKYSRAFIDSNADVVSGSRFHLQWKTRQSSAEEFLCGLTGTSREALFGKEIREQFVRLQAHASPGQYSDPMFARGEAEFSEVCRNYPESLLCAYSFITSNVAVKRAWLEKTSGFDASLRRAEDTDLGIRLWERGACFAMAEDCPAYHLYDPLQPDRMVSIDEILSFFYRHPYTLVLMVYFLVMYQSKILKLPDTPVFSSYISLAQTHPGTLAKEDLGACFLKMHRKPLPFYFFYTQEQVAGYFSKSRFIDKSLVEEYLDLAIRKGLYTQMREDNRRYFDLGLTTNWLLCNTDYANHLLQNVSCSRIHKTPFQLVMKRGEQPAGVPGKVLHCSGQYSLTIPREAWGSHAPAGKINVLFPAENACQRNVKLNSFFPADLEGCMNREQGIIREYPVAEQKTGDFMLSYGFECDLYERLPDHTGMEEVPAPDREKYLKVTYPPALTEKLRALLKKIFIHPIAGDEDAARTIYTWLLNHTMQMQNYSQDFHIMDTMLGTCIQVSRLFTNLCRLLRIPARERSGSLLVKSGEGNDRHNVETIDIGYSPFIHTWAECFIQDKGWLPVEFVGWSWGDRILKTYHITDPALRTELEEDRSLYDNFFFGNLDPYRLYAAPDVNRCLTYPVLPFPLQVLQPAILINTVHHIQCRLEEMPVENK